MDGSQAPARPAAESQSKPASGSAEERTARKTIARLDKQLARIAARETELNAQMAEKGADHEALADLSRELKRETPARIRPRATAPPADSLGLGRFGRDIPKRLPTGRKAGWSCWNRGSPSSTGSR